MWTALITCKSMHKLIYYYTLLMCCTMLVFKSFVSLLYWLEIRCLIWVAQNRIVQNIVSPHKCKDQLITCTSIGTAGNLLAFVFMVTYYSVQYSSTSIIDLWPAIGLCMACCFILIGTYISSLLCLWWFIFSKRLPLMYRHCSLVAHSQS